MNNLFLTLKIRAEFLLQLLEKHGYLKQAFLELKEARFTRAETKGFCGEELRLTVESDAFPDSRLLDPGGWEQSCYLSLDETPDQG